MALYNELIVRFYLLLAPKKMNPAETWALSIQMDLNKKGHRCLSKMSRKQNAKIFSSYDETTKYRNEYCTPAGIVSGDRHAQVSLQNVVDHDLSRILGTVFDPYTMTREEIDTLHETMADLKRQGYTFRYYFKYGADGSSGHSHYRYDDGDDEHSQNNIVATPYVALCLIAHRDDEKIFIWDNPMRNSPLSCKPLRHIYEKESRGKNASTIFYDLAFIKHK